MNYIHTSAPRFASQVTVNLLPQIPRQKLSAVSSREFYLSQRSNRKMQISKHESASVTDTNCHHGYENHHALLSLTTKENNNHTLLPRQCSR